MTDADSRSSGTVVDEQYKRFDIIKPTDPCPSQKSADSCNKQESQFGCEWKNNACAKKVIGVDKCPTYNKDMTKCLADKTCGYKEGVCSQLVGCAAILDEKNCKPDKNCFWSDNKCSYKAPPKKLCDKITVNTDCQGRNDCLWTGSVCTFK